MGSYSQDGRLLTSVMSLNVNCYNKHIPRFPFGQLAGHNMGITIWIETST